MGTMSDPPVTWRARMGGRYAVSVPATVLMVIVGALGMAANRPGGVGAWALMTAVSSAAFVAVIGLASVTVLRRRAQQPVAMWVVLAVALVAGGARAAAVLWSADALGEHLWMPWQRQVVASLVMCAVGIPGLAVGFDQLWRFREERARLRARLVALREQELERGQLTDAMTDVAYRAMVAALADASSAVDDSAATDPATSGHAAAQSLRETVDGTLRPLSHRLYEFAARTEADTAPTRVQWRSLRLLPVAPLPTALLVLLLAAPVSASPWGALAAAVVAWGVLALIVAVGRTTQMARHLFPVAALVLAPSVGFTAMATRHLFAAPGGWAAPVLLAVLSLIMLVLAGSAAAAFRSDEERNARLRDEVTKHEVDVVVANQEMARASRTLAEYLHGTVQSRMLATAFALEHAAASGDEHAVRVALARAQAALLQAPATRTVPRGLAARLDDVAAVWRGFVRVDLSIDPALEHTPAPVIDSVGSVVEEAVANARKHGGADHVVVEVRAVPGGALVRVTDDGRGPKRGPDGMGSARLQATAPGAWTLRAAPDGWGAVLEVLIPVGAPVGVGT